METIDDAEPSTLSQAEAERCLAESEADIAAGRTVPIDEVLNELRESLRRLEVAARQKSLPVGG